jgi:hypothetical protein
LQTSGIKFQRIDQDYLNLLMSVFDGLRDAPARTLRVLIQRTILLYFKRRERDYLNLLMSVFDGLRDAPARTLRVLIPRTIILL